MGSALFDLLYVGVLHFFFVILLLTDTDIILKHPRDSQAVELQRRHSFLSFEKLLCTGASCKFLFVRVIGG